jgi:hypothetical protein
MAGKRVHAARHGGILVRAAFVALLMLLAAFPTARADPIPTLTIQTPTPNGPTSEGPVGTNVTVAGQGFTPTDTVVLGYASADQGCATGEVSLNPSVSGPVGADGSFTLTFPWPAEAPSIGATYFICATDTTPAASGTPTPAGPVSSTQTYKVDASQPPNITLTPGPGPGGATPVPGETSFTIGGQIALTAANYQPGGKSLKALLLKKQYSSAADLTGSSVVTLATADSSTQLMADTSGTVGATLVLPSSLAEGTYWLYLVSGDGSPAVPPSLIAGQQITVQTPAPTPTPSSTPTPTASATPPGSSGGTPVAAIAGLGALSLLFLILGVVFLASAAALPRQPR